MTRSKVMYVGLLFILASLALAVMSACVPAPAQPQVVVETVVIKETVEITPTARKRPRATRSRCCSSIRSAPPSRRRWLRWRGRSSRNFEAMLGVLANRGIPFGRQRPSAYAGRLRSAVSAREPARLLDTLLCCALIEARSCERLGLLADALPDAELARFYASLRAAEARHHGLYVELACEVAPRERVAVRLAELAAHEASVLIGEPGSPRLHGAMPAPG